VAAEYRNSGRSRSLVVVRVTFPRVETVQRLVLIGPMAIRDTFELTVVDGVLLENVTERTLESLSESVLILFYRLMFRTMLTSPCFRSVVRS
jgi:hypothetical protein